MLEGKQKQAGKLYWWPHGKKLLFVREKATPEFWDKNWLTEDWKRQITRTRKNRNWRRIISKYLPDKNSKILEGGCGSGHLVDAMRYWGYQAMGIDFARETVAKINEVMPDLDIRYGDLRQLDLGDEYLDGYLSLGVIEHFRDGYDDILSEMRRVLKPGGYAFVSFPCISRLDRISMLFSRYERFEGLDGPEDFYQFGLDAKVVRRDFEHTGFECVHTYRQYGLTGLQRVIPASKRIQEKLWELSETNRLIKLFTVGSSILLSPLCGHSAMLVLRKL
jgi:SAM-dependent methyltransferase